VAEEGYCGHADKIKCPGNSLDLAEKRAVQGRVRARHEMLNGQLKNWGILSQVFCEYILLHGDMFRACAVLTQLTISIKNVGPLFEVEYAD